MTSVAREIQSLLDLNSEVRRLRLEKTKAHASLTAAVLAANPAAIAAAKAWLKSVAGRQRILRLRQNYYLWNGQRLLWLLPSRVRQVLFAELRTRGELNRWLSDLRPYRSSQRLAVQPADTLTDPPEYELHPHFENAQKLEFHWQSKFTERIQKWNLPTISLPESCGMTLTKELKVAPTQDRYFWKH